MAFLGMRTPSFDLSLRHPAMRKRMTRRLPQDEWLFPNLNNGAVVKFDENCNIIRTMSDLTGVAHPSVTSMREHKGYLYIGGILNNRIGRVKIDGADENWTAMDAYWGPTS
jgi:ribose transport system permease protein